MEDLDLIPGGFPGGNLIQEDSLEEVMATHSGILTWTISMDRGAWWATVLVVAKSWTRLRDYAQICR